MSMNYGMVCIGPSVVNTTQRIFMKMTTLTTIPDLYIDKVEDTRYISIEVFLISFK